MVPLGFFYTNLFNVILKKTKYQLNEDEMDLLKNDLDFSISPRFLKITDVFCQFDMTAKFLMQELEYNQISTRL